MRQFGDKQNLWSIHLHNHTVYEKLCSQIMALDRELVENVNFVERILASLCMPTRTLETSESLKVEDVASKSKSLWQRLRRKLQSYMDKSVDEKEAEGYQAVTVKSMHLVNIRARDAAMTVASYLESKCSLEMFVPNLNCIVNALDNYSDALHNYLDVC